MSSSLRWVKFLGYSVLIIGTGMILEAKTVPDEKELYSRLSPDLKRKMDQIMRQKEGNVTMKEKLEKAGEKDEVVWGDELKTKQTKWWANRT